MSEVPPGMRRNRPTPEGRLLGELLARMVDQAEPAMKAQFPDHAERCKSCAFRKGTVPNGCPETVMDATKCVIERVPFYCHQDTDEEGHGAALCAGWVIAQGAVKDRPPQKAWWPFSQEGDEAIDAALSALPREEQK